MNCFMERPDILAGWLEPASSYVLASLQDQLLFTTEFYAALHPLSRKETAIEVAEGKAHANVIQCCWSCCE